MNSNYYLKYLKYKNKYLQLKVDLEGSGKKISNSYDCKNKPIPTRNFIGIKKKLNIDDLTNHYLNCFSKQSLEGLKEIANNYQIQIINLKDKGFSLKQLFAAGYDQELEEIINHELERVASKEKDLLNPSNKEFNELRSILLKSLELEKIAVFNFSYSIYFVTGRGSFERCINILVDEFFGQEFTYRKEEHVNKLLEILKYFEVKLEKENNENEIDKNFIDSINLKLKKEIEKIPENLKSQEIINFKF